MIFTIYGAQGCADCKEAVRIVSDTDYQYEYVDISLAENEHIREELRSKGHRGRLPIVYAKNKPEYEYEYLGGIKEVREAVASV